MGSYNLSCGLTNLPIQCDDDVYMVPLTGSPLPVSTLYSTSQWCPAPIIIEGQYDDYGALRDKEECLSTLYLLDGVRSNLIEKEAEDHYNYSITGETIDMSLFFEAIQDNRLLLTENIFRHVDSVPVNFVFLRKDVTDELLAKIKIEMYIGGKFTYVAYSDAIDSLDSAIEYAEAMIEASKLAKLGLGMVPELVSEHGSPAAALMVDAITASVYDGSPLAKPNDFLEDFANNKINREEYAILAANTIKVKFLNLIMRQLGKFWMPSMVGGQGLHLEPYSMYTEVVSDWIATKQQEEEF